MAITTGTEVSPTGLAKNCNTWGDYEAPGTSVFAALCNGGVYEHEQWTACPSRNECRKHTYLSRGRSALATPSTRFSSPIGTLPTSAAQQRVPQRVQLPIVQPTVQMRRHKKKKKGRSAHLTSLYIDHSAGTQGNQSPTHLPEQGEGLFERIGKNILQGFGTAAGWQVYDMGQNADFYPQVTSPKVARRKKRKKKLAQVVKAQRKELQEKEAAIRRLEEYVEGKP